MKPSYFYSLRLYVIVHIFIFFLPSNSKSQALSYTDAASAYAKLVLDRSSESGAFTQVSNYKVTGTPYLLGEKLLGNVYTHNEQAIDVKLSYDTYNNIIEIYQQGNIEKGLFKKISEIDSFRLIATPSSEYKDDILFVNSSLISSGKPLFLQVVYVGPHFNLYKAYKTSLGYVSTNYIQPDLREFDLNFDYYYMDLQKTDKKDLVKLKLSPSFLKKEFKEVADISSYASSEKFNSDTEFSMKKIFAILNTK